MRINSLLQTLLVASSCILLIGCAGSRSTAISGEQAYKIMPSSSSQSGPAEYRIGPFDVLSFKVFQEPDFNNEQLTVDSFGNVFIPLIGQVKAEGKTPQELSAEISAMLNQRHLVNPQISINVVLSVTRQVTVEGQVKKAGIFPIQGRSSLLQAVAMAEGTSDFAKLSEVLIFRTINGTRAVARFDLEAIRSGAAPDPEVFGDDVVVVGYSSARRFYRDGLTILPGLGGLFVALANSGN